MHLTPHAIFLDRADELESASMFVPTVTLLITSCMIVISIVALELHNTRYRKWTVGANRQCARPMALRCKSHMGM
jgi:hypothetical protein